MADGGGPDGDPGAFRPLPESRCVLRGGLLTFRFGGGGVWFYGWSDGWEEGREEGRKEKIVSECEWVERGREGGGREAEREGGKRR